MSRVRTPTGSSRPESMDLARVSPAPDKVNILVVDDEPKNLMVLETVLDDPGYRLIRAQSGQEALLALMADEFAVLVLDVRMPDMTGFELARLVKERKKTARIPIIFLTAYFNEDQHVLEGYDHGAVDYLHKPINVPVLRSKVAVFAELHRKNRALELANQALLEEVSERRLAEERLSDLNASLDRRVTERTDALQASEAKLRDINRRKDEFLATLAHELRNPLAPVRNAVQVLKHKSLEASKLHWATQIIERQVKAMSRLIDDLMDVSRINQGKLELRREQIGIRSILEDAIESARPLIDENQHRVVLNFAAQDLELSADATRLTQAFMNLLTNAAKYMERGGCITIEVSGTESAVVVNVRDTGIGIAQDRLESVFELFSQVETALSRSRGGLGIGLSLTRQLVEMHNGTVVARSAGLGHGSEFVVTLPLDIPSTLTDRSTTQATSVDKPQISAPQLRILVADDNVDAAAAFAALLELMDHKVMQVHDGQAAVQAALDFNPQVVFLDIGMPKLNGYDACRQIRAQPLGPSMVIFACTGWGQLDDLRKSKEAGFNKHLVKPVDPELLNNLLIEKFPPD